MVESESFDLLVCATDGNSTRNVSTTYADPEWRGGGAGGLEATRKITPSLAHQQNVSLVGQWWLTGISVWTPSPLCNI